MTWVSIPSTVGGYIEYHVRTGSWSQQAFYLADTRTSQVQIYMGSRSVHILSHRHKLISKEWNTDYRILMERPQFLWTNYATRVIVATSTIEAWITYK
jgi:hypothetical protein